MVGRAFQRVEFDIVDRIQGYVVEAVNARTERMRITRSDLTFQITEQTPEVAVRNAIWDN